MQLGIYGKSFMPHAIANFIMWILFPVACFFNHFIYRLTSRYLISLCGWILYLYVCFFSFFLD